MSEVAVDVPLAARQRKSVRQVELIDPDSLMAEMAGQWTFLIANGAAFMMQAMHPVIGDVVGEYSSYAIDPYGRAVRSFDSVLRWVYGGTAALAEGERLRTMHQSLQMTNAEGKHISALDPDAYAWVIATAFPTAVWSAPYALGRPLTDGEEDQMFADILRLARIVQVPEGRIPTDRQAFWRYYRDTVDNILVNHPTAHKIVTELLPRPAMPTFIPFVAGSPRLPKAIAAALRPGWLPVQLVAGRFLYLSVIGPLAPEIREILGVGWTRSDQRQLETLWAGVRLAGRIVPERLRYAPLAYHARRHHQSLQRMQERDLPSFDDQPHRSCPI